MQILATLLSLIHLGLKGSSPLVVPDVIGTNNFGQYFVEARLNGQKIVLNIDTGSQASYIKDKCFVKGGSWQVSTLHGTIAVHLRSFSEGKITLDNKFGADGLLGLNAFQDRILGLDLANDCISFWPPKTDLLEAAYYWFTHTYQLTPKRIRKWEMIPPQDRLHYQTTIAFFKPQKDYDGMVVIPGEVLGVKVDLLLDTGTMVFVVPASLEPTLIPTGTMQLARGSSPSAPSRARRYKLNGIELPIAGPSVSVGLDESDVVVGTIALKSLKVLYDLKTGSALVSWRQNK